MEALIVLWLLAGIAVALFIRKVNDGPINGFVWIFSFLLGPPIILIGGVCWLLTKLKL